MGDTDDLEEVLTFGKHNGKHVEDVPASYLLWMREEGIDNKFPAIKRYITKHMDRLEVEQEESEAEAGYFKNDY